MNFHPEYVPAQLPAGHLLFSGRNGVVWQIPSSQSQYQERHLKKWHLQDLIQDDIPCPWTNVVLVSSACEDLNGNLIVGTLGAGIFWYGADGKYDQITTNELSSPYVLSVCMDREGNLWAGTDGAAWTASQRRFFHRRHDPWLVSLRPQTAVCG